MDNTSGIEVVHRQLDDLLDSEPGNDLAPPESKARKLPLGNKVVHEVVRHAEQLGGLSNGQGKPLAHADGADAAHDRERMLTDYYWWPTLPRLARRFR